MPGFAIATGDVLTLFIAASPNGGSVWARVVDDVSGAVFEQEITADLPASSAIDNPPFSSPLILRVVLGTVTGAPPRIASADRGAVFA